MKISHEELLETLSYSAETGEFHWIKPRKKVVPGMRAGTTDKKGYRVIRISQKNYFAHRLAWMYVNGQWPNGLIDHMDHDKQNNRIANLRVCTNQQNQQNRRSAERGNVAGLLGVSVQRSAYLATIQVDGRQMYLGRFASAEEASAAYQSAKKIHHPFAV